MIKNFILVFSLASVFAFGQCPDFSQYTAATNLSFAMNQRMCVSETWTVGVGGVTANTLVIKDSSNPAKIIAATGAGAYGVALSTVGAGGTVQVQRYGQVALLMDVNATAGDLVIPGTGNVTYGKDSGKTSSGSISILTRIIGSLLTSAPAGATAIVALSPDHFGTLAVSGPSVSLPAWVTPYGLPGGSWTYNYNQKGEHAVVIGGVMYAPLENNQDYTQSGIAVISPSNGVPQKFIPIPTNCMEAAPAIDNAGFLHAFSCSTSNGLSGAFLSKVNLSTGSVAATLNWSGSSVDWEKVTYDPVNDNVITVQGGVGMRAAHSADYSTAWTNNSVVTSGCGTPCQTDPVLYNGGYLYWRDYAGNIWKINTANGATVAEQTGLATANAGAYAGLAYDSVNNRLYGTTMTNVAFALNVSDLSIVWSTAVDSTSFYFDRGGAYANGVYYATDRQTNSPYASKVYAFNAATGAVIWTNTTAFNGSNEISSLLVDNTYVYASTTNYIGVPYNNELLLNVFDGTLAQTIPLLHTVSSSIPIAWGGRLIQGLWDQYGYQAYQLWSGGTMNDWTYKADPNQTGYIGTQFTGALNTISLTNTVPPGGALATEQTANQPSHLVIGTCNGLTNFIPCHLQPSDMQGGFSGTKVAGSCTLTITNGIVTNVTGC